MILHQANISVSYTRGCRFDSEYSFIYKYFVIEFDENLPVVSHALLILIKLKAKKSSGA